MTLGFRTDRPGQIVQTQIRLLLEEQSDQGLHCLLFHLNHFGKIPLRLGLFVRILCRLQQIFLVFQNLGTSRYHNTVPQTLMPGLEHMPRLLLRPTVRSFYCSLILLFQLASRSVFCFIDEYDWNSNSVCKLAV